MAKIPTNSPSYLNSRIWSVDVDDARRVSDVMNVTSARFFESRSPLREVKEEVGGWNKWKEEESETTKRFAKYESNESTGKKQRDVSISRPKRTMAGVLR